MTGGVLCPSSDTISFHYTPVAIKLMLWEIISMTKTGSFVLKISDSHIKEGEILGDMFLLNLSGLTVVGVAG